jgi:putative membrane protein
MRARRASGWATPIFIIVIAAAPCVVAQQQYPHGQGERTITANPSANNPVKAIDETDKNFMKEAALGDEAEIQLGQMAQQKASDPAVKSFGERMVKDHSTNDDQLKNIAKSQHIALPTELDPQQKEAAARLSRLSGPKFDQAYMLFMVQEHTKDVTKFQTEANDAHDQTIKQFAASSLPVLQSHLQEAQQVEQKIKKE